MSTVQINNNITRKEIQRFLEGNYERLAIKECNLKKLTKAVNSNQIGKEMRKVFYLECLRKIDNEDNAPEGGYKRLTDVDRVSIQILLTAGFNYSFMGFFLNKNRSTIKREVDKNITEFWDMNSTKSPYKDTGQQNIKYYCAKRAQERAEINKLKTRKQFKMDKYPVLRNSIIALLKDKVLDYSPDVISHLSKKGLIKNVETSIGTTTIYRAIRRRMYGLSFADLPHKAPYNKPYLKTEKIPKEVSERKKHISIEKMPDAVKNKEVDTHFEGDSIIGKSAGRSNTLITLVNVASQFTFIRRSQNKTALATVNTIDKLEKEIPELYKIMETLLLDNGTEFSKFDELMTSINPDIEKRFQIYFALAYASYQRACNENKNKLIRRYFKKGERIETLTDEDILNIEKKINNMPRKALDYQTPLEVFEENLIKKGIETSFLDKYRVKQNPLLIYPSKNK